MRLARTLAAAIAACCLIAVDARADDYHYLPRLHVPTFGTTQGTATAYPAMITVTGAAGPISGVKVSLDWIDHQRPRDLDILLVAPGGQKVMLMSDAGGTEPYNVEDPEDLWFSSTATVPVPVDDTPQNQTPYRPVNAQEAGEAEVDPLPAPAPAGPYGTDLSVLHGTDGNGEWRLFAFDDTAGNVGRIDEGWTLTLTHEADTAADLSMTVTSSPKAADIGQEVTFVATVANPVASKSAAFDVEVQIDPVGMIFKSATGPAGSACYAPNQDPKDRLHGRIYCDIEALAPGESVQVTTVLEQWAGDGDVVHGRVKGRTPADPDPSNNSWTVQVPNPSFEPIDRPLIPTSTFPAPLPAPPANGTDRADTFTPPAPTRAKKGSKPRRRRAGRGPGRLKVLDVPSPPLLFHGEPARLSDTVRASGRRTRKARVAYFLSTDRRRGRGDVALKGSRRVPGLAGGTDHSGSAKVTLPSKAKPGRWYVLACLRRQCAASDYATAVGPKADPLDVTVTDGAGAQTRTIGPGGGTLVATGADGTRFELDLPAGALERAVAVTLVPVQGISPFPLGRMAGAVRIEPTALGLGRPSTLVITPSRAVPPAEATGFGFRETGRDVHLRPFARKSKDLRLELMRFDGYGVAAATAAERGEFWSVPVLRKGGPPRFHMAERSSGRVPAGAEARADQAVQAAMDAERQGELMGDRDAKSVSDLGDVSRAAQITWYDSALDGMLDRAVTDVDWAGPAMLEFNEWERQTELIGTASDKEITKRRERAVEKRERAIVNGIDQLQQRCGTKPTPEDGARLVSLWNLWNYMIGSQVDPKNPQKKPVHEDKRSMRRLINCNRYEFRLDSRVDEDMHLDCSLWKGVGSGDGCSEHPTDWYAIFKTAFPLSPVPDSAANWKIFGAGPLEYVHADFRQRNDQCTYKDPTFGGDLRVMVEALDVIVTHPFGNPTLGTRTIYSLKMRQALSTEKLDGHCNKLARPRNTRYPTGLIDSFNRPLMMHTQSWYWIHGPKRVTENWKGGDPNRDLCTGPWQDENQRYLFREPAIAGPGGVVARYDLRGAVTAASDPCFSASAGPVNYVTEGTMEIAYKGTTD